MPVDESRSTLRGYVQPSEDRLHMAAQADHLERLLEKGFEQLARIESVGEGLWATDDGRLWRYAPGLPWEGGRNPEKQAFTIGPGLEAVWFARPEKGPKTLAELEERREQQAKEAERQLAEQEKTRDQLRKTAQPVTLDDLEPGEKFTLREASERVERAGGKVEVKGGRLIVSLPPGRGGLGSALPAARRLYAAEAEVVKALQAKAELPDRHVLPTGALAP
jgi:hypothetical protein